MNPPTDTLGPGGTRIFAANLAVSWAVLDGPAGGTIDATGTYTAPTAPGIYRVVAISTANASNSATATVTVVQSGFTFTGSMAKGRLQHTATLLPNGKVLILGGSDGRDIADGLYPVSEAELFDPTTGTFVSAGDTQRSFDTATLLLNGTVLVTGGDTGSTTTQTAELYDPTSGLFQPTGSMETPREGPSATLLADGKVLLTGGIRPLDPLGLSWETLQTAEVYDPATGTFSPTGNMVNPRTSHTATLLPDGTVLLTGGTVLDSGSNAAGQSAELYDAVTRSFTPTGSMAVPREGHTATLLLNGKVLVVGGFTDAPGATAELYDPSTRLFSPAGRMTTARGAHTATLLPNGTVLIAGGYPHTSTAELYDPITASFTLTGGMGGARFSHTATMLRDGRVLVTGGVTSGDGPLTVLNTAEIYK